MVLTASGIESDGQNLMGWRILIRSIIAPIIMILVLINMVLNVEPHQDSGKIMDGLIL